MHDVEDKLLGSFIDKFYGYGNCGSDYWFVGMEEGLQAKANDLHAQKEEIRARLKAWEHLDPEEKEVSGFEHKEAMKERWFE